MRTTVSVLLLTFITAVTAGFLVYPWMMDLMNKMKTTFPGRFLEAQLIAINETCITVSLRNSGQSNLEVTSIYVNGKPVFMETVQIMPNSSKIVYLSGTYEKGTVYRIMINYRVHMATFQNPPTYSMEFSVKYD